MLGDSLVEWGDWQHLLPEWEVLNRGISGETAEELSIRLMDEVLTAGAPDHILLMTGTNNLLMGNLFFPAILTTMLPRLQQLCPGADITLNSIFPMDIPEIKMGTIEHLNRELLQTASAAGCRFLDMTSSVHDHCLPITHPCFLEDGIHLSTRGYKVWAEEIKRHLDHNRLD